MFLTENQKEQLRVISLNQWHHNRSIAIEAAQSLLSIDPNNPTILTNLEYFLIALPFYDSLEIEDLEDDNFRPMNTCLSKYNGNIIAFVRTVNYIINNGTYNPGPPDNSYTSITKMIILSRKALKVKRILNISNQEERWERCGHIYGGGYEDIRVSSKCYSESNNIKWCAIGGRYLADRIKLFIFTISYDGESNISISVGKEIKYGEECEKNWTPIKYRKGLLTVIYKYQPLIILKINCEGEVVKETKRLVNYKLRYDSYRGGSPIIRIRNRYISIVHECRVSGDRYYFNRIVELNKKMEIIGISNAFHCSSGQKIEYIMGMMSSDDQQSVFISIGINDEKTRILSIETDKLLQMIQTEDYYINRINNLLTEFQC